MISKQYSDQVELLLAVLPEIAKETDLVLYGGTAINLFIRNLPRISVDIDLKYIHHHNREKAFPEIDNSIRQIVSRLSRNLPECKLIEDIRLKKLLVIRNGVSVKVEINIVQRGCLGNPEVFSLCTNAVLEYNVDVDMRIVSFGQLYGGKICAALDRQHPRDLFDVRDLLANEGINSDVKAGLLLSILSSPRPVHELLQPNLLDQSVAFERQFNGMTVDPFTYEDFEKTRLELIEAVRSSFDSSDRQFLLDFVNLKPNWSNYDFSEFPAIRWKLMNLEKLRNENESKYDDQINMLVRLLM